MNKKNRGDESYMYSSTAIINSDQDKKGQNDQHQT